MLEQSLRRSLITVRYELELTVSSPKILNLSWTFIVSVASKATERAMCLLAGSLVW